MAAPAPSALPERIRDFVRTLPDVRPPFRQRWERAADPIARSGMRLTFGYELRVAGIDPRGATVLDAGCGAGVHAVFFLLAGARLVHAFDLLPHKVDAVRQIARAFDLPLDAQVRDVTRSGLADGSVDVVFCTEAVSHLRDCAAFVGEMGRVLRPGGRVLISDWTNGANPRVRRAVRRLWRRHEIGPFEARDWPRGQTAPPFLFRRWMRIRRELPDLPDVDVFHLGLHTVGLGGAELSEACRRFAETGKLPPHSWTEGVPARRPEDGQHHENPVDPRWLRRRLAAAGIDARVRPHFGLNAAPGLRLVNALAARLAPLALPLSRKYVVHGRKRFGPPAGSEVLP